MKTEGELYSYLYRRDKPFAIKFIGLMLAIFALIRIAWTPLFSIILGIGAFGLIAYESGIQLNLQNNTFRFINTIGSMTFGKWQPLPNLKYISVFKVNLVSRIEGRSGASVSDKQIVIQVNLITDKNIRLRLFETNDKEKAMVFAKELAPQLHLRVWDATQNDGHWVE